jgi:hypothetical protein
MAFLTAFVLLLISLLHFYWAAGGTGGLQAALPQKANGEPVIVFPRGWKATVPTILVAVSLLFMAVITLEARGILAIMGSQAKLLAQVAAIVFAIRIIGDFRYVGLFKKVKHTVFSKWDNLLFIPLCLYLSISLIIISL